MELDFSDLKPSVLNWVIVGLMAVTFIFFAKYVVNTYDVPVLRNVKDVVNSV